MIKTTGHVARIYIMNAFAQDRSCYGGLWGERVRNRAGRHVWDVGVAADVRKKTILFPNRDKIGTSFSARVELVGVKLLSAPIGS